jgi:1-acyl-sn-glycerol-3-phosphate acyltransferase
MVSHVLDGRRRLRRDFPQFSPGEREQAVQQWARHMLQILGVELHVMGAVPKGGPLLLVSNHVSWLDILVINAVRPARFVSKADVRHWPLVGELITAAGTLYIEREKRRDAMRVVHRMADSLREGDVVAVFPEGTTGSGLDVLPFHANLLQAAISTDSPVKPVALTYLDSATGHPSWAPVYVGDTTFFGLDLANPERIRSPGEGHVWSEGAQPGARQAHVGSAFEVRYPNLAGWRRAVGRHAPGQP